jgi:hypothetical protein
VRQAQGDFREFGEPILDWFHVAMRMTATFVRDRINLPDSQVKAE